MSEEVLRKADKDYAQELDVELPRIQELVLQAKPEPALEQLLVLEKKTRQASDVFSSQRVLIAIADLLAAAPNWTRLNDEIQVLVKKHGQAKQAISALVQQVIKLLPKAPTEAEEVATIETVRTITEGRIFLELERAEATKLLANIEVTRFQNYAKAADLMGELQVETYSSMPMQEKIDYILQQIELYTQKGDYTHAAIVSRKIVPRYFAKADEDEKTCDQKIRFYTLKTKIAQHMKEYLEVCINYRHIYDTKPVQQNDVRKHELLETMILFAVLAPCDSEQSSILHQLSIEPDLTLLPVYSELAEMFTTSELIRWIKIQQVYGEKLQSHWVFSDKELGAQRLEDLRQRVTEHNIRVVAKFYTRISISGLADLLDLKPAETEDVVAKLVVKGTVWARIDRPQRVIAFGEPKDVDDTLNEWGNNTSKLLEHVETIGHLISKEQMLQSINIADQ